MPYWNGHIDTRVQASIHFQFSKRPTPVDLSILGMVLAPVNDSYSVEECLSDWGKKEVRTTVLLHDEGLEEEGCKDETSAELVCSRSNGGARAAARSSQFVFISNCRSPEQQYLPTIYACQSGFYPGLGCKLICGDAGDRVYLANHTSLADTKPIARFQKDSVG